MSNGYLLDAKEVEARLEGHWLEVFKSLCPDLGPALQRFGRHVGCPIHRGKNKDGLRIHRTRGPLYGVVICNTCGNKVGISTVAWINQWDYKTALEEVASYAGFEIPWRKEKSKKKKPSPLPKVDVEKLRREAEAAEKKENQEKSTRLAKVWEETLALDDPMAEPARLYLMRRGLRTKEYPSSLRFHPGLGYYHVNTDYDLDTGEITDEVVSLGEWPAIIGLVQNLQGDPVTLHRIYLTPKGFKAPVPEVKKMMSFPSDRQILGAAIRLGPGNGPVLGTTEGIETGLAVQEATGMPVWASINTSLMEKLETPSGVKHIVAWADYDRSEGGLKAAQSLREKVLAKGIKFTGLLPPLPIPENSKGVDWLDAYNQLGKNIFPSIIENLMDESAA